MKYGEALQERSVPQWAAYNVDYNELKHLIRVNTTRDQGQAITIPGHDQSALEKFEDAFYGELCNQHDRVGLFVKSKADEIDRRLKDYQKRVEKLASRGDPEEGSLLSVRRREKFAKLENRILRCGEDLRNLERFVSAQRIAFQKILKKYKKWTASPTLGSRFTSNVLSSPMSFTGFNFEPLYSIYSRLIIELRTSSPSQSGNTTPLSESRPSSHSKARQPPLLQIPEQQQYWNEYDNGSEGEENETYALYIDPDAELSYPGSKTVGYVFSFLNSKAQIPIEKVRSWWIPTDSFTSERTPLLTDRNGSFPSPTGIDPDVESDGEFPSGYVAHYATFPSISDQKISQNRERLLFQGMIGCFIASLLLVIIAGLLTATGRKKLRIEVDAGVAVGVVASLFFATLGLTIGLSRWARTGWLEKGLVSLCFLADCLASGTLLVLIMGSIEP